MAQALGPRWAHEATAHAAIIHNTRARYIFSLNNREYIGVLFYWGEAAALCGPGTK